MTQAPGLAEHGPLTNLPTGRHRYAAVIPAYNEVATIRAVAERAVSLIPDVIVVDDGSIDGTADALAGLAITLLRNSANLGKAGSLWRGMQHALGMGATAVITLDGDGQHQPGDILRLIALAEQYPRHVIIGSRLHDKQAFPRGRYRSNQLANFWISWAAGYAIEDSQSGFRLYPAELLRKMNIGHGKTRSFVFESEALIAAARLGFFSLPVPISTTYLPGARRSHFRPVLDFIHIARMLAWQLISRGFYPQGLYRSLKNRSKRPMTQSKST